jgi:hypothetical protein
MVTVEAVGVFLRPTGCDEERLRLLLGVEVGAIAVGARGVIAQAT